MPVSHPHIASQPTWSVTLWLIVVCALTVPASAQTDYWERANGPYGGTAVRDLEMSDVDGDGYVDFLITSAYSMMNGFQSGRTLILSGNPEENHDRH